MTKRITEEEIQQLYHAYQTPPHVIGHCHAVAETAVKLAEALNHCGYHLDTDLIRGAGLAHDIARTQDEHWIKGAEALEQLGFFDEAAIVRVHMFYSPFQPVDKLNETDIVCLADRLVKEDRYVGLDERIDYILHKAPNDPKIRTRILQRKAETKALLEDIARIIGMTIDECMTGE